MAKRPKKRNKKKSLRKKKKVKKKVKKYKRVFKKEKNTTTTQETIFKVKSDWVKKALVNKKQYEKNIVNPLNKMMNFGRKRERELPG